MKIHIAFLCPHNNTWIGGWDRKYGIYYKNLPEIYFEKYMIYVTKDKNSVQNIWNERVLTEDMLEDFFREKDIQYIYLAWWIISKETEDILLTKRVGLVNINFTPLYTTDPRKLNLIISMTDYWKLRWMHGELSNSYVVYNPIDVELWKKEREKVIGKYRNIFQWKKYIIGRIARAEPSKWHWLILATLQKLDREKNYQYGFLFAGMPWLYRKYIHLFLSKEMRSCIVQIPEQRTHGDIAEFYASIDIFWQTSWIGESFGNVITEAACFAVPTITDYKAFYHNGKINVKLYDAQIELVDHGKTGIYTSSPKTLIQFLDSSNRDEIIALGENAQKKVEKEYHIQYTILTLAKVLYSYGRENLWFKHDETLEKIEQTPSLKRVDAYGGKYEEKIALCHAFDNIQPSHKISYIIQGKLWRIGEYFYLLIRKISKICTGRDIESL